MSLVIRGFKLATSTFVLSKLDVYLHTHIPQALRFYYILCSFWEPESLFASYTILMRPKKAETAVHGCWQSGILRFMVDLRVNASYQHGHSALFVASS